MSSATEIVRHPQDFGFEADFADLAARFAAKSGGGLSPELSAELALEIVLNEIVEQACQITGATGAAIVLDRVGELVCRASSGSTAPELGSRLDKVAGISGECLRTRKTYWCDDTLTDPRADAEASRQLGVRSVVVMPLLRNDALIGVFELFSTQPYAFGVRDERALEMLADRTVTNLDHAAQPSEAEAELIGAAADLQEENLQKIGLQDVNGRNIARQSLGLSNLEPNIADPAKVARTFAVSDVHSGNLDLARLDASEARTRELDRHYSALPTVSSPTVSSPIGADDEFAAPELADEISPEDIRAMLENSGLITEEPEHAAIQKEAEVAHPAPSVIATPSVVAAKQVDYVSWALGFAVVSIAVLLGLVLGQHFVLSHPHLAARSPVSTQVPASAQEIPSPQTIPTPAASKTKIQKAESTSKTPRQSRGSSSRTLAPSGDEAVPPGGLLVSENGKEVFRLPPSGIENNQPVPEGMQPASEVEAETVANSQRAIEIPEATAQQELLHRVEPEYPEAAREQKIQGAVVLEIQIGADGSVEGVEVVSGPPLLAQASTEAVKQWKFKPRVVNGRAAEMQTRVTFDFRLPQ